MSAMLLKKWLLFCLVCFVLTMHATIIALCPKINSSIDLNNGNAVNRDVFYFYLSNVYFSKMCCFFYKSYRTSLGTSPPKKMNNMSIILFKKTFRFYLVSWSVHNIVLSLCFKSKQLIVRRDWLKTCNR